MKKLSPIIISLALVITTAFYVVNLKKSPNKEVANIGNFIYQKSCAKQPNFLHKLNITQPVAIDLSQKSYKGLAFLHGKSLSKALHLDIWKKFDHFSTYALSPKGDMFLTPMPYISVKENTFEFQRYIYRLDGDSGNLTQWLLLDDVKAGANNPYGISSLVYDCSDNTLWVSAIDETDYHHNRGVIYHIDIKSKTILQRLKGVDALSITLLQTDKGRYLLAGLARRNALVAYRIEAYQLEPSQIELLKLPSTQSHIRKIKIRGKNRLELQTIPFSYSLVAQTSNTGDRDKYLVEWDSKKWKWK